MCEGCTIGHETRIDDYVTINPGANISGRVYIASGASIGTGVQVLQGIEVNKRAVVGAGAVVTHTVPPNCTAIGVPARFTERNREIP